jgi:hypothetical protein
MCKNRAIRKNIEMQLKKILSRNNMDLEIFGHEHCLDGRQPRESRYIDRLTDAINYSHQGGIFCDN